MALPVPFGMADEPSEGDFKEKAAEAVKKELPEKNTHAAVLRFGVFNIFAGRGKSIRATFLLRKKRETFQKKGIDK